MPHKNREKMINRQIDENLRRVFQEQVEEELPDRFRVLLDRLRQQGGGDRRDDDK